MIDMVIMETHILLDKYALIAFGVYCVVGTVLGCFFFVTALFGGRK